MRVILSVVAIFWVATLLGEGDGGLKKANSFTIGAITDSIPTHGQTVWGSLTPAVQPVTIESFLHIVFSMLETPSMGFLPGDTTFFGIWDEAGNCEKTLYAVIYHHDSYSNGLPWVEVLSEEYKKQQISLKKGWNIFSFNMEPLNNDLQDAMADLILSEKLISVQDERGNVLINRGNLGGWTNQIGELTLTEGYRISVVSDCELSLVGRRINLPMEIPLKKGWNIISYPKGEPKAGMEVLNNLMEEGVLVKAQDEKGNVIESLGKGKGWSNTIGDFRPGKGYLVKVNTPAVLVIE